MIGKFFINIWNMFMDNNKDIDYLYLNTYNYLEYIDI